MKNRHIKKQLEELYTQESNSYCFDCDNKPAHWASISNGIFLCLDCSGEHRGFGINVSYIRSVTMDQWTQEQVNMMKAGGNQRLKEFLITYNMPEDIDKKKIYCSKLMHFYRKQLKAESMGQIFMEPLPPKEEFWAPMNFEDEAPSLFNTNSKKNNFFSQNDNFFSTSNLSEEQKMPKNEIIINEDQYQKARNQAEISSKIEAPIATEPKFKSVAAISSNDDRFGSVGSDPNYSSNNNNSSYSSWIPNSGYLGTVGNILGTVFGAGINIASGIKNKMNEYEVGSKLLYAGGKTVEGITYVGGKIIEKGGDIIKSDAVKAMASKTGEGLCYLKDKIMGSSNNTNNNDSKGNYSSRGSDDYYSY